ncbi:MAG: type II toxin-antitoxin system RelE/ParE family toxin [bacterium]|nr:type II toxin-antitoxin system RelE/ParE family toxin [bacterium]
MRRLDIARKARRDIDHLLWESRQLHGPRAAERYQRLISLAFTDLCSDPRRPRSKPGEIGDLRLYALRAPARRLKGADRVNAPPHVIAYRFDDDRVIILRLLHEAMDLPDHLRRAARIEDGEA